MRPYERTHPWITFQIDFNQFDFALWVALGEARSKCEHIAGVPLKPAVAADLHKLYLAKGVRGTTAIEGNTLSEEQVLERIEGARRLPPSKEYLGREVDNIVAACQKILPEVVGAEGWRPSAQNVKELNRLVLEGVPTEEGILPGEIRRHSVGVPGYRGAPGEDCEYLLQRLCQWLNEGITKSPPQNRIAFGFVWAVVAHLYMAWIHPFGDGNGRTARLLEFGILLSCGVPTPAAHLLSNHYNQTREQYYRELDRASKSGDIAGFVRYAVEGLIDGLKSQIDFIRLQQWQIAWRDYVHETFRDKNSRADVRRRHVVLDFPYGKTVPVSKLTEISPRVAAAYAGKTQKTVSRDIRELIRTALLLKVGRNELKANWEVILAFLPSRRTEETENKAFVDRLK